SLAESPAEVRVSGPSRRDASIGTEGCDLLPGVHGRSVLRAPGTRSARLRRACRLRGGGRVQGNRIGCEARSGRAAKGDGARPSPAHRCGARDRTVSVGSQHARPVGDTAGTGVAKGVGGGAERHDLRSGERDRAHDGHNVGWYCRVRTGSSSGAGAIGSRRCKGERQGARTAAWPASEIRSLGPQGPRPGRRRPGLSADRPRVGPQQEHCRRHRETAPRAECGGQRRQVSRRPHHFLINAASFSFCPLSVVFCPFYVVTPSTTGARARFSPPPGAVLKGQVDPHAFPSEKFPWDRLAIGGRNLGLLGPIIQAKSFSSAMRFCSSRCFARFCALMKCSFNTPNSAIRAAAVIPANVSCRSITMLPSLKNRLLELDLYGRCGRTPPRHRRGRAGRVAHPHLAGQLRAHWSDGEISCGIGPPPSLLEGDHSTSLVAATPLEPPFVMRSPLALFGSDVPPFRRSLIESLWMEI